jgi:hypothetical protein
MEELSGCVKFLGNFRDASIISFTETWLTEIVTILRICALMDLSYLEEMGSLFHLENSAEAACVFTSTTTVKQLRSCLESTDRSLFIDTARNIDELTDVVICYIKFCEDTIVPTINKFNVSLIINHR